jgi:ribonuclease-3
VLFFFRPQVNTFIKNTKQKLTPQRTKQLNNFQKNIGIKFKDIYLLDKAFHHRSYANEVVNVSGNNERLEFLGDAVLGMTVATYLYETMNDHPEGDLAKIKSVVVSEATLSEIALNIGVDVCISLGKGEEKSGGRTKKAILADGMEAIFGAFFLDSGFAAAEKLILRLLVPEIEKVQENKHHKDYKTLLQEAYQKKYKACPKYELINKTGPDHDQTFWVSVHLGSTTYGPAQGKSKKEAEQEVARFAYYTISDLKQS